MVPPCHAQDKQSRYKIYIMVPTHKKYEKITKLFKSCPEGVQSWVTAVFIRLKTKLYFIVIKLTMVTTNTMHLCSHL